MVEKAMLIRRVLAHFLREQASRDPPDLKLGRLLASCWVPVSGLRKTQRHEVRPSPQDKGQVKLVKAHFSAHNQPLPRAPLVPGRALPAILIGHVSAPGISHDMCRAKF